MFTPAHIDAAATTYLSVVGVLGIIGRLWTLWAVTAGKRWARAVATAIFVLGTGIVLGDLLVTDTSEGRRPAAVAGVGRGASVSGRALAVTRLWRRS